MRIIASQDGAKRQLQQWKDRRRIIDGQGKNASNKEMIDYILL
jgi:hypothetical protein